jgi:nucleoside-diphosphate-sugar epimerase
MYDTKICIVGGSGYIGFSLAKYLSNNFKVKILDMKRPIEPGSYEYAWCDIRERETIEREIQDVDLVIHGAIVQIPLINEQKRMGYEVNFLGTRNICDAVDKNPHIKGLILTSSWHTIGEKGLEGVVDEEFGFRPDKVEERARLYALSKIAQECTVRFYDEMSEKIFAVIRMGTVLGEGMPQKTAANIFIENALSGKPITPFSHSMHRPMFYVDLDDIMKAYDALIRKILGDELKNTGNNSLEHIINVYNPEPITIYELAEIVRDAVIKYSLGKIIPKIQVINTGQEMTYKKNEKPKLTADMQKALRLLNLKGFKYPRESIEKLVKNRMSERSN